MHAIGTDLHVLGLLVSGPEHLVHGAELVGDPLDRHVVAVGHDHHLGKVTGLSANREYIAVDQLVGGVVVARDRRRRVRKLLQAGRREGGEINGAEVQETRAVHGRHLAVHRGHLLPEDVSARADTGLSTGVEVERPGAFEHRGPAGHDRGGGKQVQTGEVACVLHEQELIEAAAEIAPDGAPEDRRS